MSDMERLKESIIEHIGEIESDSVIVSMALVMGDYLALESGEEKANCIATIIKRLVCNTDQKILESVYWFVVTHCKE